MIKNINKIGSFILLFMFRVLALNEFQIMNFSDILRNIFYFSAIILIIFSSAITLITNKSSFFKFMSTIIILSLIAGGILFIINSDLNIALYVCIILSSISCMIDMFYKPL